ncbi:uncharacterized protein TM35_000052800 [Trypanosoma theileri]|uniref:Uncharacterized protein n=1 Tax=Trypanosoma theileri TaxID=67003 RepID=A0A1X0P418_9TRYP|nr:uncharacterized protein TM35_000052800 [Trypanosoma theileri]ORC91684.1 hypothetical protein TM35_000052800 [Trypanosoma theileri]
MVFRGVATQHVSSLQLLVRKAYRSLHFYNADVCSVVVAALGDLCEQPLSAHAMVLSLLTTIPEFQHTNHVVQVLQGLSNLHIHHTMLTAHLLKCYLRCCFNTLEIKPATATTTTTLSSSSPLGVEKYTFPILNESPIRVKLFLSSFVAILQILEHHKYPLHLVDSFFESIEELLQTGYTFSSQCFHHIHHNNDNESHLLTIEMDFRNTSDDIFFLMCSLIRVRQRRQELLECTFICIEHLLVSFVDCLSLRHVVSLLTLIEESHDDWRGCKIISDEKEEMSTLQLLLLKVLLSRLQPENLLPGILTGNEVVVLLRILNHYSLKGEISSEMEGRLHRLAHALSVFVEKTLFTFNVISRLAESDVLTWNERDKKFTKEFLTSSTEWQMRPRLEPFLDTLQHKLYEKEEHHYNQREKFDITETLLVLCYRLLVFHVVNHHDISTETLHRVCEFTTTALGYLCSQLGIVEYSFKLSVFRLTIPVKALLQIHISIYSSLEVKNDINDCLTLLDMLTQYELLNGFTNCSLSNVPQNEDLCTLYNILHKRQPSTELLAIIDRVFPTICSEKRVTHETAEILVKILGILRSKEWVQFCSRSCDSNGDVYWITLAASVRLNESVKLLFPLLSPYSSKKESEEGYHAFEVLLSLLVTISPLEYSMGVINGNDGLIVACISSSHGVLNIVNRLLKACKSWSIKFLTIREAWDNFVLPTVNTPDLAERLAHQSRSSKLWQMTKCCETNDHYWSEQGKSSCTEKEIVPSCMEIQKWQNLLVEFAVWLGAFQCGLQLNNNDRRVIAIQEAIDINFLRELHTEVLKSATYLILCNKEGATKESQRKLLRAIYLNSQYKSMCGESSDISLLFHDEEFIRIITLLIMDLYQIFVLSVNTPTDSLDMNAKELTLLLVYFTETFDRYEKRSRVMHVLRNVVWESLIQITSSNSLILMENNDIVMFANRQNPLFCSLLLLMCFLQSPNSALDPDVVEQRSAVQEAVAGLVGALCRYTPVLRRSRPAPESLLALTLCELLEEHRDVRVAACSMSYVGKNEKILVVLVDILHREMKYLTLWEDAFRSVAERIKKYW